MQNYESRHQIRDSNRKNNEPLKDEFLKVQRLSNDVRVVIEPWFDGKYKISAQIYIPTHVWGWETRADGWHYTSSRFSTSVEGAKRVFDEMVKAEQRWLETRR